MINYDPFNIFPDKGYPKWLLAMICAPRSTNKDRKRKKAERQNRRLGRIRNGKS